MIVQRKFSSSMPDLALFVGKVFPGKADDLGKGAVVGLDLGRDVLVFNKGRPEKNECVGRSWDVVYRFFSAVT